MRNTILAIHGAIIYMAADAAVSLGVVIAGFIIMGSMLGLLQHCCRGRRVLSYEAAARTCSYVC